MNIRGKWFVWALIAFAVGFLALEFWVIKKVKSSPEKHLELERPLNQFVESQFKIG